MSFDFIFGRYCVNDEIVLIQAGPSSVMEHWSALRQMGEAVHLRIILESM